MSEPNTQGFVQQVLQQIRWKKAHQTVEKELTDHITDQTDVFVGTGLDRATAQQKAVAEMGDPTEIGTQLDRIYKPKPQWIMLCLVGLLVGIGILLRSAYGGEQSLELFTLCGLGVMAALYFVDFTILEKYPKIIFALLTVGTVVLLVFTPTLSGRNVYTQYTLLLFPIALVGSIYSMRGKGLWGMLVCGFCIVFTIVLNGFLPSPSLIYLGTAVTLMVVAQWDGWFGVKRANGLFAIGGTILLGCAPLVMKVLTNSYIQERIAAWVHPEKYATSSGFLTLMIQDVLRGAKFIGQGTSTQFGDLVNRYNDQFLVFLIGKLGWVSFVAIMVVTVGLLGYGFYLCLKQKNLLGKMTSLAVLLILSGQVALYVLSSLGFCLFIPLTFPLISQGGCGILVNLALIGLMLSTFRSGGLPLPQKQELNAKQRIIFADGKLVIDFK